MNREIKFRAWDTSYKTMRDWERILAKDQYYSFIDFEQPEENPRLIWMQYTGLKDKNGKECYHKDIANYLDEAGNTQTGIVEWQDFRWALEAIGGDDEGNQDIEFHPDHAKDVEVIGNIYENPELCGNCAGERV